MSGDPLLTLMQAEELTGIGRSVLTRMAELDLIPALDAKGLKVAEVVNGRRVHWRVRLSSLDAVKAGHEVYKARMAAERSARTAAQNLAGVSGLGVVRVVDLAERVAELEAKVSRLMLELGIVEEVSGVAHVQEELE